MKSLWIILAILPTCLSAQENDSDVFKRIASSVENFTIDTTAVPEDKLTREIRKLRQAKGGFNISEAIQFKIAEDKNKGDLSATDAKSLSDFFTTGKGGKWLENAIVRIYRSNFTLAEIRSMVKFYKSSAGKKLSKEFPVIMLQSLKAAESLVSDLKSGKIKP